MDSHLLQVRVQLVMVMHAGTVVLGGSDVVVVVEIKDDDIVVEGAISTTCYPYA